MVDASVVKASGAVGWGWVKRVACAKLFLHAVKAVSSSAVQVMGWLPLTLGPERPSCKGT